MGSTDRGLTGQDISRVTLKGKVMTEVNIHVERKVTLKSLLRLLFISVNKPLKLT